MASSALGSQSIALLQLPSGTLIDFAGTVEPSGWLMCDGRAVSRTTYAALFASISTAFGSGDGSTTFNLPDFRGRFARYNDNMGTAQGAASRDTGRAHGSAQTQATAKNGLGATTTGSDGTHIHTGGATSITLSPSNSGNTSSVSAGNGTGSAGLFSSTTTTASSGHGHTITVTGDPETRPINLACNKLIKI